MVFLKDSHHPLLCQEASKERKEKMQDIQMRVYRLRLI